MRSRGRGGVVRLGQDVSLWHKILILGSPMRRATFVFTLLCSACGTDPSSPEAGPSPADGGPSMDARVGDGADVDAAVQDSAVEAAISDAAADAPEGDGSNGTPGPDCRQLSTGTCFSAWGVRGGEEFSCYTTQPEPTHSFIGQETWSFGCTDIEKELDIQVEIPVREAGSVHLMVSPAAPSDLYFEVTSFNFSAAASVGSMTAASTNLISGDLTGTISADNTITGVVTASWSSADASCDSGSFLDSPCNEGSLTATFDVVVP